MRTRIFLSLALVAVAASVAAEGQRSRQARGNRCHAIRVEAAKDDDASGTRSRRSRSTSAFSAAEVKDLRVTVLVPEASAAEPVTVKLVTPRGRLYQVLELKAVTPVDVDDAAARRSSRSGFVPLSADFPVAGTQITSFDLFGEWIAEPYLDARERPCARPLEFEIQR